MDNNFVCRPVDSRNLVTLFNNRVTTSFLVKQSTVAGGKHLDIKQLYCQLVTLDSLTRRLTMFLFFLSFQNSSLIFSFDRSIFLSSRTKLLRRNRKRYPV